MTLDKKRLPARRAATAALACFALGGAPERSPARPAPASQIEFFEREIRPLLAERCYSCHSNRPETPFAGLRLDSRAGMLRGGDSGPAILPGDADRSRLIQAVRGQPVLMPPTGRLPDARIEALAEWIRMGAPWPEEGAEAAGQPKTFDLAARKRTHWAWRPVQATEPPPVRDTDWPANPVDRFLLAKLEARGLRPARDADRHTLIRRLAYDLTGLPAAPGEIRAFVQDESPEAYVRLVRRLLDSPRFGERWARHWMDLIRYADSHGSEGDPAIPNAWRYRDYLIRALNTDVPYDQLIREHLAGDLLASPRLEPRERSNESILGPTHLRVVELGYQPVDPWEERVKWTDNQIDVVSKAFQGLTISCARCHDHKFDAISQEDYYALFGVFYGARPTMRSLDDPRILRMHAETLRSLKARIRAGLAAEWLAAAAHLGSSLLRGETDAVRQAFEEAACDEASPLHAWLELQGQPDRRIRDSWQQLRERWQREIQARRAFNAEHFERVWDLGGADGKRWLGHGSGFTGASSEPGEFHVPHKGDQVLRGIYPAGFYTHLLSNKHSGVFQSPRFEIATDYISVKVLGGDMSYARLIIENYSIPLAGIYHQRYSPRSDAMRWWQWKTDFWKGFTGYIEFATRDDATNFFYDSIDIAKKPRPTRPLHGRSAIGAAAVAFHDVPREPADMVPPIGYLLEAEAPDSVSELSEAFRRRLVEAIEAWRDGRLNRAQTAFLDYFVRRDLLPRSLEQLESLRPLVEEYRRLETEIPVPRRAPGIVEERAPPQPLLIRGDPKQPSDPIPRRYLAALEGERYPDPGTVRLRLAEDIASPSNPLTARVMVNRIWGHLFGRGIVATPDNFGALGGRPTHPELLDYLADRFVQGGWSIKGMIELLVTSRAYRMSSAPPAPADSGDPANSLLQRMPVRRLEAEAIRDALLAVSGRLDGSMYGAPPSSRGTYGDPEPAETSPYGDDRRSVYQEVRRNAANPFLEVFDQPTPSTTRGRRDVTNVPAQSLALMNSPFVLGVADAWGQRLADGEGHSVETRVEYMYLRALGRPPSPEDRAQAAAYVAELAADSETAQHAILRNAGIWSRLAHALFNFKEFLYVP